jgi:hypothetical protein
MIAELRHLFALIRVDSATEDKQSEVHFEALSTARPVISPRPLSSATSIRCEGCRASPPFGDLPDCLLRLLAEPQKGEQKRRTLSKVPSKSSQAISLASCKICQKKERKEKPKVEGEFPKILAHKLTWLEALKDNGTFSPRISYALTGAFRDGVESIKRGGMAGEGCVRVRDRPCQRDYTLFYFFFPILKKKRYH